MFKLQNLTSSTIHSSDTNTITTNNSSDIIENNE